MNDWTVYILRCTDGSLYTGITKDLTQRLAAHNAGQGARYTRAHLPVVLAWSKAGLSESAARQEEARLKGLSKAKKEGVVLAKSSE